MKGQKEMHNRN